MIAKVLWLVLWTASGFVSRATQAPPPPAASAGQTLSLEDVVRMVSARLSEELIVARIKRHNKPFDLSAPEIVELKQSGMSEVVLKYLIDPSQPYTPPAPPAAPPAAPAAGGGAIAPPPAPAKPPLDPLVLKLPPESGVYWLDATGKPVQLELKPVVTSKAAGKSKLSLGLIKKHAIGSLAGASAKVTVPANGTKLYLRIQSAVEDLVLVETEDEKTRRDLDFGPTADKPSFPPKSVRQFESKDVGLGVIRVSLPPLTPGEYLLFILGSGEEKKGTLGKGWDFGVK